MRATTPDPPPAPSSPERRVVPLARRALIPVLIALTSVFGSVAAWRATTASGAAGAAERQAFANTLAAQQERSRIETQAFTIEFTDARRASLEAAAAALRDAAGAAEGAAAAQAISLADAYDAAAANLAALIDPTAQGEEGLDLEAFRSSQWALAADLQDLDPGYEEAQADALRTKSQRLVGLTALLIAAALFLTLAEVSRRRLVADLYWRGGVSVLAASVVLLIVVEAL